MTAAAGTTTATASGPDAGPPPEPLRTDRALAADSPRETVRELGTKDTPRDPKELAGYELVAVVRTGEGPPAAKGPEVNAAGLEAARRKTEARMTVELSQTRARVVLAGGFILPAGTELRARVDRFGHLVLLPDADAYRIAEPGALRALFGERRLDVAPLSGAQVTPSGEGARRLNLRTRRVELATRAAKATLELAAFRDAGEGGELVCRMLLDLLSAPPGTSVCTTDEVPLHAELRWTTQGALAFDVVSIVRRMDIPVADLSAPAPTSAFLADPLPPSPGETLLTKGELAAFRSAPLDLPLPTLKDAGPPPPDSGLVLVNSSDELRVAWLDGIAAAWVAPGARVALPSLVRGRYVLEWRTFLGDAWEPPETVVAPGSSEVGGVDGGK